MPPSRTVSGSTGLNSTIVGQAVMLQRFGDDPCVLEGLLDGTGTLTNEWEERRTEKYQGRQRGWNEQANSQTIINWLSALSQKRGQ